MSGIKKKMYIVIKYPLLLRRFWLIYILNIKISKFMLKKKYMLTISIISMSFY